MDSGSQNSGRTEDNHNGTKRIFSGIKPSGDLHIGSYLGAIKQWVTRQNSTDDELMFCVVDFHSMTVPFDHELLTERTFNVAAWYIAAGIDPHTSKIFVQSHNVNHAQLGWIFNCITPMGWLERMTQYKDKSQKEGTERVSAGLYTYPTLMAADILLYDTHIVPVGEDQVQHVELARDIARRFNSLFGETFVLPDVEIQKESARIMSLQNPVEKMSKSVNDPNGTIDLKDEADVIRKKMMRAVTDSGDVVKSGADKPALTNLLNIYSAFTGRDVPSIEKQYEGVGYGTFKKELADVVVEALVPIQKRYRELLADTDSLRNVLDQGLSVAQKYSDTKMTDVKNKTGLLV